MYISADQLSASRSHMNKLDKPSRSSSQRTEPYYSQLENALFPVPRLEPVMFFFLFQRPEKLACSSSGSTARILVLWSEI